MDYFLNLGSNLGNPRSNIEKGVGLLRREFGAVRLSSFMESPPWGFESDNIFVNVAAEVHADIEPLEMLSRLQSLEKEMESGPHRNSDGGYRDRLIDIDIMAVRNEGKWLKVSNPNLTIPHPHLRDRDFFSLLYEELLQSQ